MKQVAALRRLFPKAFRRRRSGFSLSEVLISIALLSIALLGTLASFAFGVNATDMSSHYGEALAIQRRIMEFVLTGGPAAPAVLSGAGSSTTLLLKYNSNGAYNGTYMPLSTIATTVPISITTGGANSIFNTTVDSQDTRRIADMDKYKVKISLTPYSGGLGSPYNLADVNLCNVTVSVQWAEKSGLKTSTQTSVYKAQ